MIFCFCMWNFVWGLWRSFVDVASFDVVFNYLCIVLLFFLFVVNISVVLDVVLMSWMYDWFCSVFRDVFVVVIVLRLSVLCFLLNYDCFFFVLIDIVCGCDVCLRVMCVCLVVFIWSFLCVCGCVVCWMCVFVCGCVIELWWWWCFGIVLEVKILS